MEYNMMSKVRKRANCHLDLGPLKTSKYVLNVVHRTSISKLFTKRIAIRVVVENDTPFPTVGCTGIESLLRPKGQITLHQSRISTFTALRRRNGDTYDATAPNILPATRLSVAGLPVVTCTAT